MSERLKLSKILLLGLLGLVLSACSQMTTLSTGEKVVHTNQWGESNRTIRVYGMGRVPYRSRSFKVWKTYTWNGTAYVCTSACMGTEAPIRNVTWPTPRYTRPYIRTMGDGPVVNGHTVPLRQNTYDQGQVPSEYVLPTR